ncbi:MAG: TatD family hydrolase [Rikenellaceae bacterium]
MTKPYVNIHTHNDAAGASTITTLGVHPWDAENHTLTDPEVKRTFESEIDKVDAVGEIGLDFAADVDRDAQERLFILQLKLAKKHRKPIVLHCVKAFEPTMQILSTFPIRGVIFHGFVGSVQQLNQAIDRGYYISFGERTFASPKTLKALRECPLERLLLETDMGQTSIEEIYAKISKLRLESVDELREALYRNYLSIFPQKQEVE